ncbi:elongator complex protein 5 [Marchantia polymorpha subsp. ruderalis]
MADSVRRQLRDGVTEGEQVPVVYLQDSLETTAGVHILKHFLNGLCENVSRGRAQAKGIVTVAMERPFGFFNDVVSSRQKDSSSADWFQVLDCYSDPLGWDNSTEGGVDVTPLKQSACCQDIRNLQALTSLILQRGIASLGHQTSERFAVLFDSISTLLRFHTLPVLMNFLNGLRSHESVSALLFLVHADLHEVRDLSTFEYFASTVIYLTPVSEVHIEGSENNCQDGGSVRIRQKRRNGRVREQVEGFLLGPSLVTFVPVEKLFTPLQSGKSTAPKVQFNLELTEKEREDRANVILPFEHQGNGSEVEIYDGREGSKLASRLLVDKSTKPKSSQFTNHDVSVDNKTYGEIHYLRDSDDELPDSDEDPDDDLDI